MWIKFSSVTKFAIKIYVGGVNAVSGLSTFEDDATMAMKALRLDEGRPPQDYVVTGGQLWLGENLYFSHDQN